MIKFRKENGILMAWISCPVCDKVYQTPNDGSLVCPKCGWSGRWRQEKPEPPDEIDFPALRDAH